MKKKWLVFPVALFFIAGLMLTGCPDPDDGKKDNGKTGDTIDFTLSANGEWNKADTGIILFTFKDSEGNNKSVPRGGIAQTDITVTNDTGAVTVTSLQDNAAPTRMMYVTVQEQGNIKIKITKKGFSAVEQTVTVNKKMGMVVGDGDIADIVKFGEPTLPADTKITFGENLGDPIAILPPVTREPVSTMYPGAPGLEHVIAVFDPPLDLRDSATSGLRWFDMSWDNFGESWDFGGEIGVNNLHNVQFHLVLTAADDTTVTLHKTSETNTSTGDKAPVRFLKTDLADGSTEWGTGYQIKQITLKVISIQLRTPDNDAWPGISATRAVTLDDMWISSLTVDTQLAPPVIVIYDTSRDSIWDARIKNPKWGYGDATFGAGGNDATDGLPLFEGKQDEQKMICWDGIDLTPPGSIPYSSIVVSFTGDRSPWYGYGIVSWHEDGDRIKLQMFNGGAMAPAGTRVPLSMSAYTNNPYFNVEKFMGFFLQWNTGEVTITKIIVE